MGTSEISVLRCPEASGTPYFSAWLDYEGCVLWAGGFDKRSRHLLLGQICFPLSLLNYL